LDAVGCERAAMLAEMDAGPLALFFAGARPERTSALILANTAAKGSPHDKVDSWWPPRRVARSIR
jgi:hypothetical protein